jgi:hypothetical protein
MRQIPRWLVFSALLAGAAPACEDAAGFGDVRGIWNTASIDGQAVPGTVDYDGTVFETEYVRWAFYDGERCTLTQFVDGRTSTYDDCTYTVDDEQQAVSITFQAQAWAGAVSGERMTLTDPQDIVWILRRQ